MKKPLMLFALPVAWAVALPAQAQEKAAEPPKPEAKKEEPKKDPKAEEYEKAVKDLTRIEGNFTFYQRKKDILIELPEEKLGKIFLLEANLHTGASAYPLQAGDPVGSVLTDPFFFEKRDDQVWLMRPNLKFRWNAQDPLAVASERSFPNAVLASFRVEQSHPEKKLLLINVTQLFYGDVLRLPELVQAGAMGQYMLDREKSGAERVRSYPENSTVLMRLNYVSPRGSEPNPLMVMLGLAGVSHLEDSRSLPLKVSYNLWFRKDTGYTPRLSDPRVGYFTQDFFSVDKLLNEDRTERFIMRFNLKKKDPTAAISEPVKPIVWVIDHSVPPQYRPAVKAGLLRWNKAFENLGYKDAVRVQDAPNDPEWDHADGRFNVVRWVMSPDSGYAIAHPRVDPYTGEVLSASITFDANMLSFAENEHQTFATPSAGASSRALSVLLRDPKRTITADKYLFATPSEEAASALQKDSHGWHFDSCSYGYGLTRNASFAWNALQTSPTGMKVSKEEYAKQFITDVISHEAGHCLGLRHNFVASTNLTTAQLGDDSLTAQVGLTASVMDYTPVNIMAVLKGKGNFFAPTIGTYDVWAVRYGYSELKGKSPLAEKHELSQIASQSTKPGHAFMTDENADGWDPYVVRFDNARDPLEHSAKMLQAAQRMRKYAVENLPRPGESYSKRTTMILRALTATFREGRYAARFVGGIHASRDFAEAGMNRATLAPVSPGDQRRAVRLITQNLLGAKSFDLPQDVLNTLSADPDQTPTWTAPLRELIGMRQNLLVSLLMSADTTDRIAENAFKAPSGTAYTMDEHYGMLLGAIFSEVGKGTVPALRRDLQRFMVTGLISQASAPHGGVSEDVRAVASDALRRLSTRLGAASTAGVKADGMTRTHLRDTKETIDRFLRRQHTGR